jgi:hypothetical protein
MHGVLSILVCPQVPHWTHLDPASILGPGHDTACFVGMYSHLSRAPSFSSFFFCLFCTSALIEEGLGSSAMSA